MGLGRRGDNLPGQHCRGNLRFSKRTTLTRIQPDGAVADGTPSMF